MLFKIIDKLRYKLILKWIKPEIIGFKDALNKMILNTRVSNMSHLSNIKNIILEENVFIGHFNYIDGFRKVRISKGCQITNYVTILTHSSHNSIRFQGDSFQVNYQQNTLIEGEVTIGEYSYIGAHSVIMPGTKLGKGCIVSAFSYVNGEFPDYTILRGQPAIVIGSSLDLDEKIIEKFPELSSFHYLNQNVN
jgi:acetyltransferase-like isoleucine patch superfamily enzyme